MKQKILIIAGFFLVLICLFDTYKISQLTNQLSHLDSSVKKNQRIIHGLVSDMDDANEKTDKLQSLDEDYEERITDLEDRVGDLEERRMTITAH